MESQKALPAELEAAIEDMTGADSEVTLDTIDGNRITFKYTGVVHTHQIPDKWSIVGIGSSWFAVVG